ncbi:hypothetical protein ACQB6R_05110 [Propionibacteriaceae bacterium G1746]|uniref:hypothetical protein n=1 Tax=Aestuariimicrobium sp. G57 TaxID=3418485 RepID=UPI003C239B65
MKPHDRDEVDRRFQELMSSAFTDEDGFGAATGPAAPPVPNPRSPAAPPPPRVVPFTANRLPFDGGDDDDEHPAHDDDLSYRDSDGPLLAGMKWSGLTLLGFVLFTGGLIGMFAMIFGVQLGAPWAQLALAGTVVGLGVLMFQALRRHPDDEDEGDAGMRL